MGRYRCFLPDLAGFAAFPCAGPGYQRRAVPKFSKRGFFCAPYYNITAALMQPQMTKMFRAHETEYAANVLLSWTILLRTDYIALVRQRERH